MKDRAAVASFVVLACLGSLSLQAQDIRITIPKRSQLTPVQRLNREGVDQIRRHQYDKAEATFYKAYLYDPSDPFTLNNLGYISELQGELPRAEKFYSLASEQGSNALIDRSSEKGLRGKPMTYAMANLKDLPMRINRMNVDAIEMLSENRNAEADMLLKHALAMDPHNVFTLNNMGVAKEASGDYEAALSYYRLAAEQRSSEPIVVTLKADWRGKPVSKMAAESAKRLQSRMAELDTDEARAAVMNVRGVTAANENDWGSARQFFLKAYKLDPNSAFSLNNAGYIAEREGDLETAQFFYSRAQKAGDASAKIGVATQRAVEGSHLGVVATNNGDQVQEQIDLNSAARREQKGPIELLHRNGTPVVSTPPPAPQPPAANGQAPSATAPDSQNPAQPAPQNPQQPTPQ